jgi:hypothetical protein
MSHYNYLPAEDVFVADDGGTGYVTLDKLQHVLNLFQYDDLPAA